MADDNDQKEFIEKTEAESKKVLEEVKAKKDDIESSGMKEVKELKYLLPDKERELEKSLDKLNKAKPDEQEDTKKEAEANLGKVKQISDSLLKEVKRDQEMNSSD